MKKKYTHKISTHNIQSPELIVPFIMELFQPKSVIDFGCGLGTFLHSFKLNGVQEVLGIDGYWVDRKLLYKYLNEHEFLEKDLEKEITLKKTYDLVLSIEVAEHLSKHSADIFVKNLISAGNIIVFSAAIPKQGGENHINEQWLEYWEEKFIKYNFQLHDVLRPIFWNNSKINWWYKQNIVLFVHKDEKFNTDLSVNQLKNVIHPELYTFRIEEKNEILRSIMYGELPIKEYILLLFKSIFGLNNIRTIKRNLNLCKTKIFRLF